MGRLQGWAVASGGLLALAATCIFLLHSSSHVRLEGSWLSSFKPGCAGGNGGPSLRDLRRLAGLSGNGPDIIMLTDDRASGEEVLSRAAAHRALVVVTAGRGRLTRRRESQPYISIAEEGPLSSGDSTGSGGGGGPLAPLAGALSLLNAAAAGVERVLGRRLFPITLSTFERREETGPYAVFDASAGRLLLDRALVERTWGGNAAAGGEPPYDMNDAGGAGGGGVSYLTSALAARVFGQVEALLTAAAAAQDAVGDDAGANDANDAAGAAAVLEALYDEPDTDSSAAASAVTSASAADTSAAAWRRLLRSATSALPSTSISATPAAAAVHLVAAAVGAALPAAFAAAPPLWFCVLCPTVLGLVAPLAVNLALNRLAGVLCAQLQLTDDQCFDVLLGALGAGFVLSLASAVPIFFVCQLPACAGRNVSRVVRGLARRGA